MDRSIKFRLVGAVVVVLSGIIILPPLLKAPPPELVITDYIPPRPVQVTPNKPDLKRQDWTIGDVLANQNNPDLADLRPQAINQKTPSLDSQRSVVESPDVQSPNMQPSNLPQSAADNSVAGTRVVSQPAKKQASSTEKNAPLQPVDIAFDDQGVPIAWLLQVGSFSNNDNAKRLKAQLIKQGYNAQIKTTPDAKLTRVYVGPSMDKQGLAQDQRAIEQRFNLTAQLVRYRLGE